MDIIDFARTAEMQAYHAGRTAAFRTVLSAVCGNEHLFNLFKTTPEEPDDESETSQ